MALRTARSLVVRGRPPGCAAGRTGATQAHAALVRSVSGNRECIVRSLWPGSALFQGRRQLFKHPLNQRRSSSLGAASPHQASICIASFFIPRGHRRFTSNRAPSSFAAGSYTRLIWIIVICTSERPPILLLRRMVGCVAKTTPSFNPRRVKRRPNHPRS
jgi:hypothetical protein